MRLPHSLAQCFMRGEAVWTVEELLKAGEHRRREREGFAGGNVCGQQVRHLEAWFLMPIRFSLEPMFESVDMFSNRWNRGTHELPSRPGLAQRCGG